MPENDGTDAPGALVTWRDERGPLKGKDKARRRSAVRRIDPGNLKDRTLRVHGVGHNSPPLAANGHGVAHSETARLLHDPGALQTLFHGTGLGSGADCSNSSGKTAVRPSTAGGKLRQTLRRFSVRSAAQP